MEKQKNIPFLRFPEFTGEWEYKKLGEEISFLAGYAFDSNEMTNEPSKYQLIKMSNVYRNELRLDRNPTFWANLQDKQRDFLLQNGDIVLTLTGTVGKRDYGYSIMIIESDKYLLNQRLVRLSEKKNRTANSFIRYLVSYERFLYHFFSNSKGGTGNQSNVSIEDLKNMQLSIPSLPEQTRIASFLTAVDDKLIQLKQKKTLLEQYKKGVMQKIFTQELRFKDENGKEFPEWTMRKLSEVANKKSSNISANKIEDNYGNYIIYGASGVLKRVDFYEEENEYISIIKDGAGVGRIFYCEGKTSVLGTMEMIKPNLEINTYFLYCLLSNIDFEKYITGTTIPHIYFKDYSHEICGIPCLAEQTKISNFLSSVDRKISLCCFQVEKTEQYKKGLLQKMFC